MWGMRKWELVFFYARGKQGRMPGMGIVRMMEVVSGAEHKLRQSMKGRMGMWRRREEGPARCCWH